MSAAFGSPIPLSEIEGVLAWVDTFKLSRPTKKINRDFSDAVLLAEILGVHYPKLVEMHNYPPRNSHALKLNNWMTLNRKVLKKLKITLCTNTMEQLSNCTPGVIERVLVMVRDKIKRDEELEKSTRDAEANMSSGGSYYEACGDDEGVLIVPVKTRVNGVLETLQQKVVSYEVFTSLKEELKDAKDTTDLLKQKVDHLDSLIKLKDERITELQKQIDRKQIRRKEAEILQNSISAPFEDPPSPTLETAASAPTNKLSGPLSSGPLISGPLSSGPLSSGPLSSGPLSSGHLSSGHLSSGHLSSGPLSSGPLSSGPPSSGPPSSGPPSSGPPSSGPPSSGHPSSGPLISGPLISGPLISGPLISGPPSSGPLRIPSKLKTEDMTEVKLPTPKISFTKIPAPVVIKPSVTELPPTDAIEESKIDVDRIKSDIFKEANVYEDKVEDKLPEAEEEFKDSEPGNVTILEDIDTVKEPYDKKY